MRVAFLSPCWPHDRYPNGIASYVASLRSGLETLGLETYVLTSELSADVVDPLVVRVPDRLNSRSLRMRMLQRGADLMSRYLGMQRDLGNRVGHSVSELDARAPLDLFELEETFGIGSVVQRHFGKPVVVRLHGPWCVIGSELGHSVDKEYRIRCAIEKRAIAQATAVSSPSSDALNRVRSWCGLELPNARVIPNPVPMVPAEDLWSEQTCDADTILFVGRFDRVKGADILLQAFSRIAAKRPELRLVFVGPDNGLIEGPREIGIQAYLQEQVPAPIRKQVVYRGTQTKQQIARERRRAALTVVSSRYETFSIAAAEAMAAGSPLIASRAGGIAEFVCDEQNGLLFDSGQPAELARQIERLLDDRGLAARLGARARADALERFSEASVAEQTRSFYEEVIRLG